MLFDVRPVTVRIQVAKPVTVAEVGSSDVAALHATVMQRMRELIQYAPDAEGVSLL